MIMEGENKNKIESAQEEMEILKKRIAELEASSQNKEKSEIIKEAIQEHAGKSPEEFLANEHKFTPQEIQDQAQRISNLPVEKQHQEQILELMQIVQAKGLLNALSIVDHIQDPHLEDEFHDALVKYFQSTH
ncbi:hypothetical protein KJ763_01110 [Patescibacteria group bacterium]|nr:hypothetical protein [Patescibacteria group bacterium]